MLETLADTTVSIIPDGPTYIHQKSDYANNAWSVVLGTDTPDSLPVSISWSDNLGTTATHFIFRKSTTTTADSIIGTLNFTGHAINFPDDKTEGVVTAKVTIDSSLYTTEEFAVKYTVPVISSEVGGSEVSTVVGTKGEDLELNCTLETYERTVLEWKDSSGAVKTSSKSYDSNSNTTTNSMSHSCMSHSCSEVGGSEVSTVVGTKGEDLELNCTLETYERTVLEWKDSSGAVKTSSKSYDSNSNTTTSKKGLTYHSHIMIIVSHICISKWNVIKSCEIYKDLFSVRYTALKLVSIPVVTPILSPGTLELTSLDSDDTYTCGVKDGDGYSSTKTVEVKVANTLTVSPSEETIYRYETTEELELQCSYVYTGLESEKVQSVTWTDTFSNATFTKSGDYLTYDEDTFSFGDTGTATCTVKVLFDSLVYTATHSFSIHFPAVSGGGTVAGSVAEDVELTCEIAASNSSLEIQWTLPNGSEALSGLTTSLKNNKLTSKLSMTDLQMTEGGNYSCAAEDSSAIFNLVVYSVACSPNQLVISGSDVEITCLVKLSSTGSLAVNFELDGVKGVANEDGSVRATQKLTNVKEDDTLAWTLHLGGSKVDHGAIELSAYNKSDSTCPLLSFSSGTLECEGNECLYSCPDNQYYQSGSDLRTEMNVTCDNSNSQWSHVTKTNPFGDFPTCSGLAEAKSRKLEAVITMSGATACHNNMRAALLNFFTSSGDYTCLTKSTCTLTTSDMMCFVANSAVSIGITVTQNGASSDGIYAFESQLTSNPTSVTFTYISTQKRSTVSLTSTGVTASYDVECSDGAGQVGKECLTCPAGSYSSGGVCEKCSVGSYQPNSGKTQCSSCEAGLTTVTTGSDSITDCTVTCEVASIANGYRSPASGYTVMTGTPVTTFCSSGYSILKTKTNTQTCTSAQPACFKSCVIGKKSDKSSVSDGTSLIYQSTLDYTCNETAGNPTWSDTFANATYTTSGNKLTYEEDTFKFGDSGTTTCVMAVTYEGQSESNDVSHTFTINFPAVSGGGTVAGSVAEDVELTCEIAASNSSLEIQWTLPNGTEASSGVTTSFKSNKITSVACSPNQLVISGSDVVLTCLVKLSSTGLLTVALDLDGVKGVANDDGSVLATQKLTNVDQDDTIVWTLHLGGSKVANGVIELSAYNNSDSTCPLLSFSSGTLECEGNECLYSCPDNQYYQSGSDLRTEMNVTCDNSNSQWSHVSKTNPIGDFPTCSGLAEAKSRKLEAVITMSGATACHNNMGAALLNFFTSSGDYTCLTKSTCTLTTSDMTCFVANSAVSFEITVTQKGASSDGINAFESQLTSNPTSVTFSYISTKKRSTVSLTSTGVTASYDVECSDGAGQVPFLTNCTGRPSMSRPPHCEKCSVGSYQPNSGKTQCTSCETGLTTVTTGSDSITDCTVTCEVASIANGYRSPASGYTVMTGTPVTTFCSSGYSILKTKTNTQTCTSAQPACFKSCVIGKKSDKSSVSDGTSLIYQSTLDYTCSNKEGESYSVACSVEGSELNAKCPTLFWIIVGCSIGGAVVLLIVIILVARRRPRRPPPLPVVEVGVFEEVVDTFESLTDTFRRTFMESPPPPAPPPGGKRGRR
eukprot:sb/3460794/